ncbi:HCN4, partial [Symbiodinium microadriaticum]
MLKRIDFFRNFGPAFLDELLSSPESIRKVLVMPGTVLLREGAPGDSMMVVSKGRVAASVNGRVVKHLGEGSYFGELVFLGAALLRTATVTATTFCDVRIIYNRSFKRIADKYPE